MSSRLSLPFTVPFYPVTYFSICTQDSAYVFFKKNSIGVLIGDHVKFTGEGEALSLGR